MRFYPKNASIALLPAIVLAGCGVNESAYKTLQAQNQQLQAENASLNEQLSRVRNAVRFTVNQDLAFKSGSWELSEDGQQIMGRLAQQLAPYQTQPFVINGYTDNAPVGAALRKQGVTSNEILSQRRAEAVRDFLASHGVKAQMMSVKGWGEANPVAPNSTAAGRAENRRVEITFANQGS
jgi:chemotaxis protein MotB